MTSEPAQAVDAYDDEVEDASSFVPPRRPMDDEIDMTPMIDCVFLLIIFFVLTFNPDPAKSVALPPAKFGSAVVGLESVIITVTPGEGNAVKIYLADFPDPAKIVNVSNPLDQEQAIIEYVKKELSGPKPKKKVIVQGDGDLTAGQIALITKAAGQALDGQTMHLAVKGVGQ